MKNLHTIRVTDENGQRQEYATELAISELLRAVDSGRDIRSVAYLGNGRPLVSRDYTNDGGMPLGM